MTYGTATQNGLTSIHGRKLSTSKECNLTAQSKRMTHPCIDATITVGDEAANVRAITIQLTDANGDDVSEVTVIEAFVMSDATGTAIATTGGSTGIAIGTDGAILTTITAKKHFVLSSESDGDIDLTWTDTGTESVALALKMPNGNMITTAAFANA